MLRRALASPELDAAATVEPAALDFLAARTEGDARAALNALELALDDGDGAGRDRVGIERAEDALQRRAVLYDRGGDRHYDYISAWIKATRGSDPDASLYYLAVMLEGGEDPRFIVRRMVILASEDVGNADPAALRSRGGGGAGGRARGAARRRATRWRRPRSTWRWRRSPTRPAGRWARRARTCATTARRRCRAGCARVRRPGQEVGGYDYPHDHPGRVSPQELLPEAVAGARFYEPDEAEAELARRLEQIRAARRRPRGGHNRERMSSTSPPRAPLRTAAAPETAAADGAPGAQPRDRGAAGQRHHDRSGRRSSAWWRRSRKVQPLWALLRVQDRARYMRRVAQAVIDEFDELRRDDRARAGPPASGGREHGAAAGDRRADLDRRRGRAGAGLHARRHPPLDGAVQARAGRLRALRRDRA